MCTTLYVRTPLHGACVGIMFHTWVKNVFRIVDFFMKGFKRVPLPLYISVAILAQEVRAVAFDFLQHPEWHGLAVSGLTSRLLLRVFWT